MTAAQMKADLRDPLAWDSLRLEKFEGRSTKKQMGPMLSDKLESVEEAPRCGCARRGSRARSGVL